MKIIALVGSPRRGKNTQSLVESILNCAAQKGAAVKMYHLADLHYQGCQSCYACKGADNCALPDDVTPILAEVAQADAVVLGTPIYMWQMSGQLKLFVDRLFAFYRYGRPSKLPPGKKVLLAASQGNPDEEAFLPYLKNTGDMLKFIGFGSYEILCASSPLTEEKACAVAKWLTE